MNATAIAPLRLRAHGFTLLEVLVVMALILIVLGMAVLRLDDAGQRRVQASAERLSLALEAARDTAIYSGQTLAFSSDGRGYQFWRGNDQQHSWQRFDGEPPLSAYTLPAEVFIVQQRVNTRDRALGERLVFSPDGLSEPFEIRLQAEQSQRLVQSDALGRIHISEGEQAAP